MSHGGLHEVHGRAAVEGVADMGVAEPVRRHRLRQPRALGRALDDAVRLRRVERAAAFARAVAWCMDQGCRRNDPNPVRGHAIRT